MSMYSFGNGLYTGKRSYNIVGRRKLWFTIAITAVLISLASFAIRSPNLAIEFRGGSQFTVSGTATLEHKPAYDVVAKATTSVPRVSDVGQEAIRVQTESLDDTKTHEVRRGLAEAYDVPEADVTSTFIGPSWGQDILSQAIRAMIIFMALISVVLIIYFKSWTIAVGAIGALLHDFVVTLGIYWILGFEIAPATIIGLLTIMGYSLYDTVVVFDKVRENTADLEHQSEMTYAEEANLAINQTLIRSLNTSVTGWLPVLSVLFIGVWWLGAETLRDLALVMLVGMVLSAASSVFVAAPLAVWLAERDSKIKAHTARVLARREELSGEPSDDTNDLNESSVAVATERLAGGRRGQRAQPKRKKRNKR